MTLDECPTSCDRPTAPCAGTTFASWRGHAPSSLVGIAGANSVENTTVVFSAVLLVAVLPLINSRPSNWIALALVVTWSAGCSPQPAPHRGSSTSSTSRWCSSPSCSPESASSATTGFCEASHRRIGRRLLLVTVGIILSWAFTNLVEPQRLIAGWVLAVEPFLLLMAVVLAPMTARERKMLLIVVTSLLCGQLPFSLIEIATGGVSDEVKGTLLEAGAGHHVSAGGLALGFFLVARLSSSRLVAIGFGAGALLVMVVADAKQVLFVLPLALLVFGITGRGAGRRPR